MNQHGTSGAQPQPPGILRVFSWIVAGATFVLILSGGQVTSTDSGDAVPTWPLPLLLPMEGGVFFELGHRQVAATVGILTGILVLLTACLRRRVSTGVFRGGLVALLLVLVQATLGGLRVWMGTAEGTSESIRVTAFGIAHAMLAQVFFSTTVLLAFLLNPRLLARLRIRAVASADDAVAGRLSLAARLAVGALLLQLLLGALLRLTRPGPVPVLVFVHLLGMVLVVAAAAEVMTRVGRGRESFSPLFPLTGAAMGLLTVQILVGFTAWAAVAGMTSPASAELTWRTIVPTIHAGLGALLLADFALVLLVVESRPRAG